MKNWQSKLGLERHSIRKSKEENFVNKYMIIVLGLLFCEHAEKLCIEHLDINVVP